MKKHKKIELLADFLCYLNEKGLIANHYFVFEKEAEKYLKSLK